jgi:hypothetical protein
MIIFVFLNILAFWPFPWQWRNQDNVFEWTCYVLQTKFGRHNVFAPFLIIITSPRLLSGNVLLFYVSFSLLLLRQAIFIEDLPQMLPTKFQFIWLRGFRGED